MRWSIFAERFLWSLTIRSICVRWRPLKTVAPNIAGRPEVIAASRSAAVPAPRCVCAIWSKCSAVPGGYSGAKKSSLRRGLLFLRGEILATDIPCQVLFFLRPSCDFSFFGILKKRKKSKVREKAYVNQNEYFRFYTNEKRLMENPVENVEKYWFSKEKSFYNRFSTGENDMHSGWIFRRISEFSGIMSPDCSPIFLRFLWEKVGFFPLCVKNENS